MLTKKTVENYCNEFNILAILNPPYVIAFLPRDAMRYMRGICRRPVSVCVSVCVSVTLRYMYQNGYT